MVDLILHRATIGVMNGNAVTLDVEPAETLEVGLNTAEVQDAVQHAEIFVAQRLELGTHLLRMQVAHPDIGLRRTTVLAVDTRLCQLGINLLRSGPEA